MADTLLEVDGIETCYGLSQVLFGLQLTIKSGEMIALMGRNGMGKTTTIRTIMGLTPPRAGAVRLSGRDVRGLAAFRIAQLGIGDRKSTRLNSSHRSLSRMPSSA